MSIWCKFWYLLTKNHCYGIKNTNTELIPKSIFKGTNADGSKFTVNEWSPNSIGNTPDMIGCSGVMRHVS
jgi:hypothetical protein